MVKRNLKRPLTALLLLAVMTAGQGTPWPAPNLKRACKTLEVCYVAHILAPDIDVMKSLAEKWNRVWGSRRFRVEVIDIDRESFLLWLLRSGSPKPDLVLVTNFNIAALSRYLLPLNLSTLRDVYPQALRSVEVDGKVYGVPIHVVFPLLIYRRDLIRSPPRTWEEALDLATSFTRAYNSSSPTDYGMAIYSLKGRHGAVVWQSIIESMKGSELNLANMTSREMVRYLELYGRYVKGKYSYPSSYNQEFSQLNRFFERGEVAMLIQWSFALKELLGHFDESSIGVAPLPTLREGARPISRLYTAAFAVNKRSPCLKEALLFLKYLTSAEALEALLTEGALPPYLSLAERSRGLAKSLYAILSENTEPAFNWVESNSFYESLSTYIHWFLEGRINASEALALFFSEWKIVRRA